MRTQTVFRAGNSSVVAIPADLAKELGVLPGHKVVVERGSGIDSIAIRRVSGIKKNVKQGTSREFKKWLRDVLEEDGEILDELAVR